VSARRSWLLGAVPLVMLAVLVALVAGTGFLDFLRGGAPPVEDITFDRVTLAPGTITVELVNGGPDPVTIAQVTVDEAYWAFTITPDATLGRLGRARLDIPYPWVEDESHQIALLTSTGVTFEHEIAVARASPTLGADFFGLFGLIGLYVGVIPVAIGLLWYPFLRRIGQRWLHFVLALTAGLLIFLGFDALHEALETGATVAGPYQGPLIVLVGMLGAILALQAVTGARARVAGAEGRRTLAWLVALGIGLHNLGEGLAIGAAYALGEAALGTFLIVGFMIHNSTEGLGIVAPIAHDRPAIRTLLGLGFLAGAPTILGAWIGGAAYSPVLATLFLSVGAGAIAQVVMVLYGVVARETAGRPMWAPLTAGGLFAGLLVMYGTGLLVA